jgi:type I restriction enzyme S subunit
MKVYPKYKSSGVDLIGDIPEHWKIIKIKFTEKLIMGQSPDSNDVTNFEKGLPFLQGNAEFKSFYPIAENWCNNPNKIALKDDLLLSVRAPVGALNIADQNYGIGRGLCAIRAKANLRDFLFYFFSISKEELNRKATGSTFTAITVNTLANVLVSQAPLSEQQQIVDFLDYKTGQCDRFISNRQKQIELLNEQKATIINKAVTKGINPNAKMKPSDIDWIGDIPEHWECMKIKRLSVVKRGASPRPIDDPKYFDENGEFAWVRIADVTASERYLENTTQRLSKLGSSLSVKMYPNDFFLSIAGSVGKPIITKIKCCIHDGFVWFPYLKINHEFLYYLFSTGLPYQGLGKFGTQLNLNTDTVGDIFLPIPTADEMTIIVSFIDNQTQKIDCLISKYQKQIELMQEYRTALISQAVTGKIDVREWKPQTK